MTEGNILTGGRVIELSRPASKTIQGIKFVAKAAGVLGNDVTITLATGADLAVAVAVKAITVTIAATSTIGEIMSAIQASATAKALVYVDIEKPYNTVAVAAASSNLAGGTSNTYALVETIKQESPVRETKVYDGNNKPAGRHVVADFKTLSATIIAEIGLPKPIEGDKFNYAGTNYSVGNVGEGNSGVDAISWEVSATEVVG